MRRFPYSVVLILLFAGCSIHPLPEDFARDNTSKIVEKIRCEARQALIDELLLVLERSNNEKTLRLKQDLIDGTKRFSLLDNDDVDTQTLDILEKFRHASIAFKFLFTITESNDNTANAGFKMPFTNGTFSLALKAGSEKERKAERTVEFAHTFQELVVGSPSLAVERQTRCEEFFISDKNILYPITGQIGLSEFIKTYTDLVNHTENTVTYKDEITFTTKLLSSVKPSVELTKFDANELRLASADFTNAADRTDAHQVTLVVTDTRQAAAETFVERVALGSGAILEIPKVKVIKSRAKRTPSSRSGFSPVRENAIFNLTPRESRKASDAALRELRRLESLDRQRKLIDIIEP